MYTRINWRALLEKGLHNCLDIELAQVGIRLTHTHKYDGLPRSVRHGYCRANLWYYNAPYRSDILFGDILLGAKAY